MIIKLQVLLKEGNFLNIWESISFSRRYFLHGDRYMCRSINCHVLPAASSHHANNKQPIPSWEVPRGRNLSLAFSHIVPLMWGRRQHCYSPSRGGVTIATNYNCLLILLVVNSLLVLLVAQARLFNRPIINRLRGGACSWPLPGLATVHFPR
jgi:hypothetical protein